MKHKCCKCNKRAVAIINGKAYVCGKHAQEATVKSLALGEPVIQAVRGEPRFLLVPVGSRNANCN